MGRGVHRSNVSFPPHLLDQDAVKVVQRLTRNDHIAYFVGGCVRDLLLKRVPKDFDIGTTARPRQVKKLFRNCWIIGRRFKLAHVNFGSKQIEVSTFRGFLPETLQSDRKDLLITRDNLFGTPEQDAWRRDFTINGLFYDLNEKVIHDHIGGLEDIEGQIIGTIGDPEIRLREDPVRILRAIKFASRLSFKIDPGTYEAMIRFAPDIARCAPPRVLEEILRILRGGAAEHAFRIFLDTDVLQVLLPEVDEPLRDEPALLPRILELLRHLDKMVADGEQVSTALCLTSLFLPIAEGMEFASDRSQNHRWDRVGARISDMIDSFRPRLNVPKAECARLKEMVRLQRQLRPTEGRRRFTRASVARRPGFFEALEVFRAQGESEPEWTEEIERWTEAAEKVRREEPPASRQTIGGPYARTHPNRREAGSSRNGQSQKGSSSRRKRPRKRRRPPE